MSTYISSFSPWISDFFAFRRALGYSDHTYGKNMKAFDLYCAASYPEENHLTEEIVLGWLEDRCTDIYGKARCLRPREGRELKTENINFQTGELFITHTKRNKDRIVVMSDDMRKLAVAYNEKRKIFGKENEYFFPSWSGRSLSQRQVDYFLKNAWKDANPECKNLPGIRTYDLRYRFASAVFMRWIDKGETV